MISQTWLVTGGAGFIGSNFVRWDARESTATSSVVVFDKLTYAGSRENLRGPARQIGPHTSFFEGDIASAAKTWRTRRSTHLPTDSRS